MIPSGCVSLLVYYMSLLFAKNYELLSRGLWTNGTIILPLFVNTGFWNFSDFRLQPVFSDYYTFSYSACLAGELDNSYASDGLEKNTVMWQWAGGLAAVRFASEVRNRQYHSSHASRLANEHTALCGYYQLRHRHLLIEVLGLVTKRNSWCHHGWAVCHVVIILPISTSISPSSYEGAERGHTKSFQSTLSGADESCRFWHVHLKHQNAKIILFPI